VLLLIIIKNMRKNECFSYVIHLFYLTEMIDA